MGSVKEVSVINNPQTCSMGEGDFIFSDRYSVFDWGEMPDLIDNKGAALCILSSYFFSILEKQGIKTHFLGPVDDGKPVKYEELKGPSSRMRVKLVRVIKPLYNKEINRYSYSAYVNENANFLIPLEVIYRNRLPEGSSVFKRIKNGNITFKDLGLDHEPVPGEELKEPILDVSTKLEHTDRYISWDEAMGISGLGPDRINEVKELILKINKIITKECGKAGIENVDGKFEFAVDSDGNITVVDVLGTPDECRFLYNGFHISKETARRWYRDTDWSKEAEKSKSEHGSDWKKYVKTKPPALPKNMKKLLSEMYMAVANEITGKKFFNVPALAGIITELKKHAK